jgi:hypothetical protein
VRGTEFALRVDSVGPAQLSTTQRSGGEDRARALREKRAMSRHKVQITPNLFWRDKLRVSTE